MLHPLIAFLFLVTMWFFPNAQYPMPNASVCSADALRGFQREAADKHGDAMEQLALQLGEQIVAPVDQGAQRLLARQGRAAAAGQQPEAVVHVPVDLLDGQRPHAGGGELDSQRKAIQPVTDLNESLRVVARDPESRLHGYGALDEEPDGFVLAQG